jgi:hypothetical protein
MVNIENNCEGKMLIKILKLENGNITYWYYQGTDLGSDKFHIVKGITYTQFVIS